MGQIGKAGETAQQNKWQKQLVQLKENETAFHANSKRHSDTLIKLHRIMPRFYGKVASEKLSKFSERPRISSHRPMLRNVLKVSQISQSLQTISCQFLAFRVAAASCLLMTCCSGNLALAACPLCIQTCIPISKNAPRLPQSIKLLCAFCAALPCCLVRSLAFFVCSKRRVQRGVLQTLPMCQ